jgi:hypothetical protein
MGFARFIDRIRQKLNLPAADREQGRPEIKRSEKTIVFILAFVIALGLWMLINLGRDFVVTLELPLVYGEFPEEQAPVRPLPDYTRATFTGEGWKLLALYGNPPRITVNPDQSTTNIFDAIQNQITSTQDLSLNRAEPSVVEVRMEQALSRTVPIENNVEVSFRRQYGKLGEPMLRPDSVRIFGARSLVENITYWPTRKVVLENVNQTVSTTVELEDSNDLIQVSHTAVRFDLDVTEFTEGEVRVPVELAGRNGRPALVFTPSTVVIRYNVPVTQYSDVRNLSLFRAIVHYDEVEEDTSGYIVPDIEIEESEYEVSVRSVSPRRVSYFRQID